MRENRGPEQQETSPVKSSWETLVSQLRSAKVSLEQTYGTGKELLKEGEVREGSEAALRSVINIAISCADVVPGAGELASWGADVAAIIEEIRYRARKKEAEARGEDPNKVKREKYNLTPDVHILIKTLTEPLELIPIPLPFMMPTHSIETIGQLYYDIPRMIRGVKRAREVLTRIREQRQKARDAAKVFRSQNIYENIYGKVNAE